MAAAQSIPAARQQNNKVKLTWVTMAGKFQEFQGVSARYTEYVDADLDAHVLMVVTWASNAQTQQGQGKGPNAIARTVGCHSGR